MTVAGALRRAGLRAVHLQAASLGSVGLCVGLWIRAKTVLNPDTLITPNAAPRTVAEVFLNLFSSRPAAQAAVDISGSDLENVAGGLLDNLNATCNISGGLNLLSSNVAIELG